MAKSPEKRQFVYDFVLTMMEAIYKEKQVAKVKRRRLPKFPTKKSIADFVLSQTDFLASDEFVDAPQDWSGEKVVGRTTVIDAVNELIEDNLIAEGPDGFEFVPHTQEELEKFPILDIAEKINISVGVPENLLLLTVKGGFANQLAEYLSAQFYKGDIIFIPLGQVVVCIGVLPKEKVFGAKGNMQAEGQDFRTRIETVLHMFKLDYPAFSYGDHYELAYAANKNPAMRGYFKAMAKHLSEEKTARNIIDKRTETEVYSSVLDGLEQVSAVESDVLSEEESPGVCQDDEQSDLPLEDQIGAFFDDRFDELIEM